MIDSTAVICDGAEISDDVDIGPFCYIGKKTKIGQNCKIHPHVFIDGDTEVGSSTEIFPFATIGTIPQDLKYMGEDTKVKVGSNCKIREYVTINLGTTGGGGITKIGNNCLLMVGTHIAHDCKVEDNVIFANHSTLAGHVIIESNVVVGALSAIHQFTRVGEGSMIGGMSGVTADVIPFGTVLGNRAKLSGLNIVGLKRNNFDKKEISELRKVFRYIFLDQEMTFNDRLKNTVKKNHTFYTIKKLLNFLSDSSERSFCLP